MGGSWDVIDQELPVSLIHVNKNSDNKGRWFQLNEQVEKYFLNSDVSDLKIVVISIAGIMREGKSFLISFFLRYATFMYYMPDARGDKPTKEDWMGNEETELSGGFKWRHAVKRETSGILMWPYLFKCTLKTGETVCIMILDTQGTHDAETMSPLWSGIFAVSTLISSVQMYNIMRTIGEEHLQNLELHCGYGKLIAEVSAGENPYQNLMFLVRDFKYGQEYEFGLVGGEAYLQDQVVDTSPYTKQSRAVRKNIVGFFDQLSCCVLPDPGIRVMEQRDFSGKMKEVDKRFREVMKKFVPKVLSPENLVLKRVNGMHLTTRQLFNYIKVWVDTLNEADLPQPNTLFKSTALTDHIRAMEEAMEMYRTKMEAINCSQTCYVESKKLDDIHTASHDSALAYFLTKPKFGKGGEMTEMFQKKLEEYIREKYREYSHQNMVRVEVLVNAIRAPVTTFFCIGFCHIFKMLGFKVARWVKLVFYAVLLQWIKDVIFGGIASWHSQ